MVVENAPNNRPLAKTDKSSEATFYKNRGALQEERNGENGRMEGAFCAKKIVTREGVTDFGE
jgi:hypothetical protein